jgi:bacillithiol biosynthesis deacetylase BshB1
MTKSLIQKLDILAFAAHPDDVELSACGTLLKHIALGMKVGIIDLTQGELGTRGNFSTRKAEAQMASQILGIHVRENLGMPDGFFEINTDNKIKIIEVIRKYRPQVILANAIEDRHPDHGRAAQLVAEATFLSGLPKIVTHDAGEEQKPHRPKAIYHYIQDYYLEPDFVVDVTPFVDKKIEAIKAYKTQFFDPDSPEPATPISGEDFFEFITGRMMQFGRPAGMKYAEGFNTCRSIGVDNLLELK